MAGNAFQQLMTLSRTNTEQQQGAVEKALEERKRREDAKRREAEEAERKEKQRAEQERKRYFEKQKLEVEAEKRRAERERIAEAAIQKRKDEARDALLYGPKKAKAASSSSGGGGGYPKSASGVREDVRAKRTTAEPMALTREELRERKQAAEQRKMLGFQQPSKRPSNGTTRAGGRRLPGGAVDMMSAPSSANDGKVYKSVRERLAAQPNVLQKLNVIKRDVRSIDEIMRDRAQQKAAKTLQGDEAKGFDGWFADKKKTAAPPPPKASTSEWSTPVSGRPPPPKPKPSMMSMRPPPPPAPAATPAPPPKKVATAPYKPKGLSTPASASSQRSGSAKKRSHSYDDSDSDERPAKRRSQAAPEDDYSNMIWQMFGKNRKEYVSRDINSDDEDMEADSRAVEREENASARAARREDEMEREAERRHEAEKARRRAGR